MAIAEIELKDFVEKLTQDGRKCSIRRTFAHGSLDQIGLRSYSWIWSEPNGEC